MINDFCVEIVDTVLLQTESGWLRTDSLTILPYIETPVSTITIRLNSINRTKTEDVRSLVVTFNEESFLDYLNLDELNFTLSGAPAGLGIEDVTGNSPTQATILLEFDSTDFRC